MDRQIKKYFSVDFKNNENKLEGTYYEGLSDEQFLEKIPTDRKHKSLLNFLALSSVKVAHEIYDGNMVWVICTYGAYCKNYKFMPRNIPCSKFFQDHPSCMDNGLYDVFLEERVKRIDFIEENGNNCLFIIELDESETIIRID